jgi:hypothetical protein
VEALFAQARESDMAERRAQASAQAAARSENRGENFLDDNQLSLDGIDIAVVKQLLQKLAGQKLDGHEYQKHNNESDSSLLSVEAKPAQLTGRLDPFYTKSLKYLSQSIFQK